MTVAPCRSTTRVAGATSLSTSASLPTATMRFPVTAIAWPFGCAAFSVCTMPWRKTKSALGASASAGQERRAASRSAVVRIRSILWLAIPIELDGFARRGRDALDERGAEALVLHLVESRDGAA